MDFRKAAVDFKGQEVSGISLSAKPEWIIQLKFAIGGMCQTFVTHLISYTLFHLPVIAAVVTPTHVSYSDPKYIWPSSGTKKTISPSSITYVDGSVIHYIIFQKVYWNEQQSCRVDNLTAYP